MTTTQHTQRPPIVRFTHADFFRALRQEATYGPAYVRRQAQRMLNRILGPTPRNWEPRAPHLPELSLTPGQRAQFHLHPHPLTLLTVLSAPYDTLTTEEEDPEQPDDPL